jgi:Glyoxalase/Bleomycin resistance protein/Dioxygenase superfamily
VALVSGPPFQICWVVEDHDSAADRLGATYGVGAWTTLRDIHFAPDTCTYRGRPADFTIDVSMAYAGDLQLELICPRSGDSLYAEFLAERGPGVHHLAWIPDDFAKTVADAEAQGATIAQRGTMAGNTLEFAYVEPESEGTYIELMRLEEPMRAFFDSFLPEGSKNPWNPRA